ncbi:MAG: creatininase family protein [Reyranella sp.]|nr:creatininase family protein [Reyranella sp.]
MTSGKKRVPPAANVARRRTALALGSLVLWLAVDLLPAADSRAAPRSSVYLEELTWPEVRDALRSGTTTVIVPIGGTEQNGPHMALGKHNVRVKALAGSIADRLGDTLVAPVLSYVPEGSISPPAGHMRFPGTISIPDDVFKGIVLGAGRSLKQAGFLHVVLIGDSGDYQSLLGQVASQLNREWAGTPVHAHFIADYYRTAQSAYVDALRRQGLSEAQIGTHAGAADTSLMLALDPALVHLDRFDSKNKSNSQGVAGDPTASSAALGRLGVELIITKTVAAIRAARGEKP